MRVLIYGAGEVGTYLAKMLCNANHDVILMDEDEDKLLNVEAHYDLMTIVGSGTSIESLKEANVKSCNLFIAVPPFQDMSILSSILAKKLGAKKTVSRINNSEYLVSDNREYFKQLGIDELIYPEVLASKEIAASLKQVGTRQLYEFSDSKLVLFALKIRDGVPIANKSLAEVSSLHDKKNYNTVAIIRDDKTIIPRGDDSFLHNDLAYVITTHSAIPQVLKDAGKVQFDVKNVMILGGSRIGEKVAKLLEEKYNVKIIEIDKNRASKLADILEETLVISGDGRDLELLKDEGIKKMDAFIAVTGNSEVNILACQLAKKYGVKKTVAEVENIDYIDLAVNIGIGTLINKKLIAASHIYRLTLRSNVAHVKCLTAVDAEVLEFVAQVGSKITAKPIRKLGLPKDVNIGGIIRGDEAIIANGDTMILPDDKVVVFTLPSGISKIEKMFN